MMQLYTLSEETGQYLAAPDSEIIRHATNLVRMKTIRQGEALTSPSETKEFLNLKLGGLDVEKFCCLFLDNRHRVIEFETLSTGTLNGASVYPREVVKRVLALNAAAVIFAHNHPSGVPEPSRADENMTSKLVQALALIEVRVLDHFIIGEDQTVSFAERGLL